MKYKIKINYSTGNSFGLNNTSDILELDFEDLNVAKANLLRIKEHYELYKFIDSYTNRKKLSEEDFIKECSAKDWFVKGKYDSEMFYNIKLYTDTRKVFQLSCFWIGFFEKLHFIEIILDSDVLCYEF
jgi:hypothetical protein